MRQLLPLFLGIGLLVVLEEQDQLHAADGSGDTKPPAAALDYDFRGSRPLPPEIRLAGALHNAVTQAEPGGFRITIAGDQPNPIGRAGLELHTTLHGDFEITAGYELLVADPPTDGYGVGFELFAHTVHKPQQGLGVYRLARVAEGDVYLLSRNYLHPDGKPGWEQAKVPTTARSGRLRITRTGAQATAFAAEGADNKFKELRRFKLGDEDIKVIWLMAYTGHAQNPVDLRVTDLQIRSGTPIPMMPTTPPAEPEEPQRPKVALYLALALVLMLVLCTTVMVYGRRRQARKSTAAG